MNGEELKPGPHKIQGLGAGFIPKTLDMSMVDKAVTVSAEESLATTKSIIKQEGILAGISCGAALAGLKKLMSENPDWQDKTIVVIMPDSGERYLSTMLYSD